jgi:hypothetical protein
MSDPSSSQHRTQNDLPRETSQAVQTIQTIRAVAFWYRGRGDLLLLLLPFSLPFLPGGESRERDRAKHGTASCRVRILGASASRRLNGGPSGWVRVESGPVERSAGSGYAGDGSTYMPLADQR